MKDSIKDAVRIELLCQSMGGHYGCRLRRRNRGAYTSVVQSSDPELCALYGTQYPYLVARQRLAENLESLQ